MGVGGTNVLADFVILVTSNVDQAIASLGTLTASLSGLAGMATAMTAVGQALTMGVTLPIMAIGVASVLSANTLQGFWQTLQAGAVGGALSFEQLKDSFNTLYSQFPQGGTVIANTLLNVSNVMGKTFGENQKEIQDFAQSFLQLSMVTGEDANKMSAAVVKAFDQWGVSAQDAQADLQFLWQAAEQARTSITSLADQVGQYSQIMLGAGFNIKDTTAAIAQMDQNGMDLSKTVTGMAYGMATLSAGGKTVAPILAEISKEEGGISTATMTTHQMWDGLTAGVIDGSITMGDATAIFGKRYATNIYEAIKNGHLSFDQFEQDAANMKTSMADAATASETFSQKLETLKHDVELALAPLGISIIDTLEGFMPVIQEILGAVGELLGAFNKLPAPLKDAVIIFALILASIGPILWIMGSLITAVIAVAGAVGTLSIAFLGLDLAAMPFEVLLVGLLLPVLAIVAAVALIAVGLLLLYTYFQPFHDGVNEVVGWFGQLLGDLTDMNGTKFVADLNAGIAEACKTLTDYDWGTLASNIASAVSSGISQGIADQTKPGGGLALPAVPSRKDIETGLTPAWPTKGEPGPNVVSGAAGDIMEPLKKFDYGGAVKGTPLDPAWWTSGLGTVKTAIISFAGTVGTVFQPVIKVLREVGDAFELIGRIVLGVTLIIIGLIVGFTLRIYDLFKQGWNSLVSVVGPPLNTIKMDVINGLNAIYQFFVDIWNRIVNAVGPPLNTLKNDISTALNDIYQFFQNVWNTIVSFFQGIWDSLNTKASTGANSVKSTAEGPFDTLKKDLEDIWNTIVTDAENAMNGLAHWFSTLSIPMPQLPDIKDALINAAGGPNSPGGKIVAEGFGILDEGGIVTEPTVAVLAANRRPELVLPLDNIRGGSLTGLGSASQQSTPTQGSGGFAFTVTFQNPIITNKKEAEDLSYQIAYGARNQLRRAGYST